MKAKTAIALLAHPNSLRNSPGRPEFTTEDGIERRWAEGRGSGSGPDYVPWFTVPEFHSSGFRRMVWCPRLKRVIHLFSELEFRIFLWLEANHRYTEIRECFPLPREQSTAVARRHGLKHPAPFKVPVVLTTDFLVTVLNNGAESRLAIAVKYERDLTNPRTLEKLMIEGATHEESGTVFQVMTENSVPKEVFLNLRFVRGALREGAMQQFTADSLDQVAHTLRQHLTKSPIGAACLATDTSLRLPSGSAMQALRYFVASHRWKVDLHRPITPEAVLFLEGDR